MVIDCLKFLNQYHKPKHGGLIMGTVTKELIKDMKKADTIVFRIVKKDIPLPEYARPEYSLTVECIFKEIHKNDWVKPETRISHNGMTGNIFLHDKQSARPFRADWVCMSISQDGNIQALASILKPGDILKISVAGGDNSERLNTAGLNNDELTADISRPDKNGNLSHILQRFVIDHQITGHEYRAFKY